MKNTLLNRDFKSVPKKQKHPAMGRVYDLQSLLDRLNRLYFDSSLPIKIEWSRRTPQKATSSVELGSYNSKEAKITISRRLDNPRVPLYFLENVIFHEMLHHVFPRDQHRMHTAQFNKYERMHPDFERAKAWEKSNLKILFESAQSSFL